jgi:hypothetical protein
MEHLNSIRAALRGAAPVVAIPVPGHAPVCIKAKLLKGARADIRALTPPADEAEELSQAA